MFFPDVPPWVEQANDLGRLRIGARKIGVSVAVAAEAGERKVRRLGGTAGLPGDDVIRLKPQFSEAFGKSAMLTPELRAPSDQGFEPRVHAAPWT